MPHRTMRFVEMTQPGGPDVLRMGRTDVPAPGAGEVLIRVLAAGVNRPDAAQRKGIYPPPPGASPILGLEVAGVVEQAGEAVAAGLLGARVCALTNGGGYAEYVAVPAGQCLPWPVGASAIEAAALPETSFTVWQNLFVLGGCAQGKTALVHGGSSGIGTTAIQYGTAMGARVYVTAGTEAKCEACRRLGAAAAINYRSADFAAEIAALTEGRGVDTVLDMVGAPYLTRNLACLAEDGRLVFIAFQGGAKAEAIDLAVIQRKRLTMTGSALRPRSAAVKAGIASALLENIWPVLNVGRAMPVIEAVFPLEQAAAAHAALEAGEHIGKFVLRVAEE